MMRSHIDRESCKPRKAARKQQGKGKNKRCVCALEACSTSSHYIRINAVGRFAQKKAVGIFCFVSCISKEAVAAALTVMQTNRIRGSLSGVWHFFESFSVVFLFAFAFCFVICAELCTIECHCLTHIIVRSSMNFYCLMLTRIAARRPLDLRRIGEANAIRRMEIGLCQLFSENRLSSVQLAVRMNLHTIDRHH